MATQLDKGIELIEDIPGHGPNAQKGFEVIRPISGLDNSFPSFHVSLTLIIIIVGFLFRVRMRRTILVLGMTVVISTYILGIHWIADIIAGLAVGALSVMLALRLEHRFFAAQLRAAPSGYRENRWK